MVKKHYVYNAQDKQFYLSERSLGMIWKVALAALCGMAGAVACLPAVWFAGMKERTAALDTKTTDKSGC